MPSTRPSARVFISSASGDLLRYREAAVEVCHRVGLLPVHMENFNPGRPAPLEVCRREVEESDVFVLLLADRYGTRPPGEEKSFTELEYDWAISRGREMPIFSYATNLDARSTGAQADAEPEADTAAQRRFVAKVSTGHIVGKLSDVQKFRESLIVTLTRHLYEHPRRRHRTAVHQPTSLTLPPELYAAPPYVGSAPFTGRLQHLDELDEWGRSAAAVMVVDAIGGTGKSALTWQWVRDRAVDQLKPAGRFWWSFYDGSNSIIKFLQELLAYATGDDLAAVAQLDRADLAANVISVLKEQKLLVVLDGFERLLNGYNGEGGTAERDAEIPSVRRMIAEPNTEHFIRCLTKAGPSKILVSTRTMPKALEGHARMPLDGVRHMRLPGLSDEETASLLGRLHLRGDEENFVRFFKPLDNHPLLIGIVAGLVRGYRSDPGNFDAWLEDPYAGGALNVADLKLVQRQNHILSVALTGLPKRHRKVLGLFSQLNGIVAWESILSMATKDFQGDVSDIDDHVGLAARVRSQLDAILADLEDRGLLWWERASNKYDMHPIVRQYVGDQLNKPERIEANLLAHDYFQALPPEDTSTASSVEDLRQTIAIYQALVGGERTQDAGDVWKNRLAESLLVQLGASSTALELLEPLARQASPEARSDLVIAHSDLRQYSDAIRTEVQILESAVSSESIAGIALSLSRLSSLYGMSGAEILATRCLDLQASLQKAVHWPEDANIKFKRGVRAAVQGQPALAFVNFTTAEGPAFQATNPWFRVEIYRWRTQLRAMTSGPVDLTEIDDIRLRQKLWGNRYTLTKLQCTLALRQGSFSEALDLAQECERLEYAAGVEAIPAASAFALAMLERRKEAGDALTDALDRLQRVDLAARPHYWIARAFLALGCWTEAAEHATVAYQQAWRDGPPNCHFWDLDDARNLLAELGWAPPDLPVVSETDVAIPAEQQIRLLIRNIRHGRISFGSSPPLARSNPDPLELPRILPRQLVADEPHAGTEALSEVWSLPAQIRHSASYYANTGDDTLRPESSVTGSRLTFIVNATLSLAAIGLVVAIIFLAIHNNSGDSAYAELMSRVGDLGGDTCTENGPYEGRASASCSNNEYGFLLWSSPGQADQHLRQFAAAPGSCDSLPAIGLEQIARWSDAGRSGWIFCRQLTPIEKGGFVIQWSIDGSPVTGSFTGQNYSELLAKAAVARSKVS